MVDKVLNTSHIVLSLFLFLFYQLHAKSGAVNQTIHPCFYKRLTIGQLHLETATTKNEEQNNLSNKMYIVFQIITVLKVFFEASFPKWWTNYLNSTSNGVYLLTKL